MSGSFKVSRSAATRSGIVVAVLCVVACAAPVLFGGVIGGVAARLLGVSGVIVAVVALLAAIGCYVVWRRGRERSA